METERIDYVNTHVCFFLRGRYRELIMAGHYLLTQGIIFHQLQLISTSSYLVSLKKAATGKMTKKKKKTWLKSGLPVDPHHITSQGKIMDGRN